MILVGVSLYAIVLRKSKGITNTWTQLLWFLQMFLFGHIGPGVAPWAKGIEQMMALRLAGVSI